MAQIEKKILQMIKTFIKFFLGLVFTSGLMAQDFKKDWTEGKLSWSDFSEMKGSQVISELKYFLEYNTDKQRFGDTTVIRNVAKCYMDKKLSWINPDFKNDQYLRYNQVVFDIVELHRRRLQYELDRANSIFEIEGIFNYIYNSCNVEIAKFQKESNVGRDLNSIVFWEQKILDELRFYSDTKIPEFENRDFGYAIHAGMGSGFFTGSLGEHFTPTFNFMFGFDFAYKKSILYLNGTLAGDKVKKDYISDKNWYKGQHVNVAIIDISYGYALIDNAKLKVSPFAGLGITEFSGVNKDSKKADLRIDDYNIIFGINADYKLRTRLKLVPDPAIGLKEKVETSIRARLYVSRAKYYADLQGYSINLTIGICGFGNFIRVK